MLKLKICEFFTEFIFIPYIAVFATLMKGGHHILAFVWIFTAAALTVLIEDTVKAIIRKLRER